MCCRCPQVKALDSLRVKSECSLFGGGERSRGVEMGINATQGDWGGRVKGGGGGGDTCVVF